MLTTSFQGRPATLIRVAGLIAVCWSVFASDNPPGTHGRGLVISITLAFSVLAWIAWTFWSSRLRTLTPDLYVLAVGGGVLCAASPGAAGSACAFVAVISASMRVGITSGWPIFAAAVISLGAAALIYTRGPLEVLAYTLGFMVAMLTASNARQSSLRAEQAELLLAQSQRSHEEALRNARLKESTRIARDIHDVLAHTLAGLTIQLEATEVLLAQGAEPQAVSARVHRAHQLAREGLLETRRAVGALRDDDGSHERSLGDRLRALCADYGDGAGAACQLSIDGDLERLAPSVGEAIARAVQESLTNISKHARGAAASVRLELGDDNVQLLIDNEIAPSGANEGSRRIESLAGSGGGFGLRGMGERATELGGVVQSGPFGEGWRVELTLPLGGGRP